MTVTKIFRREEAVRNFRKMWQWMAKEGIKRRKIIDKREYFTEHNLERIKNDCYLCSYVDMIHSVEKCEYCPVNWGGYGEWCIDEGSLYCEWDNGWEFFSKNSVNEILRIAFLCIRISYLPTYEIEWEEVRKKKWRKKKWRKKKCLKYLLLCGR